MHPNERTLPASAPAHLPAHLMPAFAAGSGKGPRQDGQTPLPGAEPVSARTSTTERPPIVPVPDAPGEVPSLTSVARLRALLKQMETDLGLVDLSEHERDVLYAAWIASRPTEEGEREFTSDALRASEIADVIAPATFYRALKALRERGLMHFAKGRRRNHYTIDWSAERLRKRRQN